MIKLKPTKSDEEVLAILKEYKKKYNIESDIVDRLIEKLSKSYKSKRVA